MAAPFRSVFMTLSPGGLIRSGIAAPAGSVANARACLRSEHSSTGGRGVDESVDEYKYVERLVPPSRIPSPPKHEGSAPSGWTPPPETPPSLPYMIRRSRMHNVPVYSDIKHGNQKSTLVRKVEGDVWALNKDVKEFLQQLTGRETATQVNEVTGTVRIKGHFEKELKAWLIQRGF
ncbi:mitochondrial ribosomal protein L49 [Pygocentrus nattereri]|uniref:Large ribosomal subunit protein mL49 n=1 Tax=Pygocentrus nattereri TaxID=42514 RepID=A0A3B4ENZ1_PYGNA|nr:mitochondrial ribosomal protein L49 [Pygocentrus nattereri]